MVTFTNGPAKGSPLELRRAPLFLRVVIGPRGKVDALDQLDDTPNDNETVHIYKRTSGVAVMFACGRGGCRGTVAADYEHYLPVFGPTCDFRNTDDWQAWCTKQNELDTVPVMP